VSKLVLNLAKPGDVGQKLSLNLSKGEEFKIRLSWDGATDLDLHALVTVNAGEGAKASSFDDILSTYNVQRTIRGEQVGTLPLAADKTFSIHNGALLHSPDARDGDLDGDDEYVVVKAHLLKMPVVGQLEIPVLTMIHPQSSGKRFKDVQNARVIIEDSNGQALLDVSLSQQFSEFVGVQMGSIVVDAAGPSFVAIGVGFNTDFNGVLGHFS
jgi:tellurium resistance protein TerD